MHLRTIGAATYASSAREKRASVKATRGVVFSVVAANLNSGGDRYLFVKSKATALADTDAPTLPPIKLAAGETKGYQFPVEDPAVFADGIQVGLSTTDNVYTTPVGDEGHFYVRFI
jgi:hypothetical protein